MACVVLGVDGGAGGEKERDRSGAAFAGGVVQRRLAGGADPVGLGAVLEEDSHVLGVLATGGKVQRRTVFLVHCVDFRPVPKEQGEGLLLALGRPMQRRFAVVVTRVDIGALG